MRPKSQIRKRNCFPNLSLRAPERCVAISLEKARLLRFARKDSILNRDLGEMIYYNNVMPQEDLDNKSFTANYTTILNITYFKQLLFMELILMIKGF